jgi:hypothetical protein
VAGVKGWEPIPSALIGDVRLSLQTRAVYMVLRNLIWQETRATEDVMSAEIGTLEDLAKAAGCSRTAMKAYLAELREAGWIDVARIRRGHPFTYTVFSVPTRSDSGPVEAPAASATGSDSDPVQGRNPTHSRAGSSSPFKQEPDVGANAPTSASTSIEDFLEEKFGRTVEGTNASGRRRKAAADLRKLDATPDSLRHALVRWPFVFRDATITDIALATHYPQLVTGYTAVEAKTETPTEAERRWVSEQASDPAVPLSEVLAQISCWTHLDPVESGGLFDLAEETRDRVDRSDTDHGDTEIAA